MQLWDAVQPSNGDLAEQAGDLPLKAQNGYTVIRETHTPCDRTKDYQTTSRVLRHRCPLRNCGHRHLSSRYSSTPNVYYGQEGGGVKSRCYQPARTYLPLNHAAGPNRTSSSAGSHYPAPTTTSSDHVSLCSRGLPPSYSQTQPGQNTNDTHLAIPLDYRKKAVQYIIKQLKVEGHQDIHKVLEIQQRISSMENQIFHTITSQEEYVIKLASKLAAILQQLNQRRPAPSQHRQQPACL